MNTVYRVFCAVLCFTIMLASACADAQEPAEVDRELRSKVAEARGLIAKKDFVSATEILQAVVKRNPEFAPGWQTLGFALHSAGDLDNAILAHQKASKFPETQQLAFYNLACAYSLKNQKAMSIENLKEAIRTGFNNVQHISQDRDLTNVRNEPMFKRIVAELNVVNELQPVRNVAIFIHEGVELLDFAGPGEVFSATRYANNKRAFNVYTVAATKDVITSQRFLKVTPNFSFADCPKPDIVVLPGGATPIPLRDDNVIQWISQTVPETEVSMSV